MDSRKGKLGNTQVQVVTCWDYTEEASPAFKRLMLLLLKPLGNQSAETLRADEEHQNEQ